MSEAVSMAEVAARVGWDIAIAAMIGYLSVVGHALWWLDRFLIPAPPKRASWVAAKFVCAVCGEPWAEVYHVNTPGEHRCSVCGTVAPSPALAGKEEA